MGKAIAQPTGTKLLLHFNPTRLALEPFPTPRCMYSYSTIKRVLGQPLLAE